MSIKINELTPPLLIYGTAIIVFDESTQSLELQSVEQIQL